MPMLIYLCQNDTKNRIAASEMKQICFIQCRFVLLFMLVLTSVAHGGIAYQMLSEATGTTKVAPNSALVEGVPGIFYGESYQFGETNNNGAIFSVTTSGAITRIFSFNGWNGSGPIGGLTFGPDGNLYGVTTAGEGCLTERFSELRRM